ncbi:glucose-induced degradation protein 8 homolog [Copidosoma floridanum]|uniref:glucose-induced degradation protein 8 homolog n=1 Tax=Copidosoma floridanum TaxID=29053 RepID=UPI0006C98E41|nr:glucose-induced degradation protein 8 homolog [Copidosoma floridanum]XP_014205747.1 glucose-induced degradation protein 8 homolog [Copidosoma floridanum]
MSFNDKQDHPISKEEWMIRLEEGHQVQRTQMNNLIMNYLVTEGFKEAAEKFQQESGVKPAVELDSMDDRIRIRDAIQNGRIEEAKTLVNQLHPELLDNDRYLHFHLQQLHLIELIRSGRIEEALQFAQEQLSEAGESDENILGELERTLALLAFDEPQKSPFSDLLHPTHRQKIASELNAAILKMEYQESTSPRVNNLLKMILWAQDELDKKKVKYPKMTDLGNATIEGPK